MTDESRLPLPRRSAGSDTSSDASPGRGGDDEEPGKSYVLRARDVTKRYGDLVVLTEMSVDVHEGETVAVIGPSGSGKSTLLRVVMGLEAIDGGHIEIEGHAAKASPGPKPDPARSRVGMIFQHFHLFPHMTVLRNITEAPVRVKGMSRQDAEERARQLLRSVGLEDKADAYPAELSGGQKQRVAIARALALEPALLLCDEVTSALDPELVGEVLAVLRDVAESGETALLLVTHEMGFARAVADRVVFIDEGRVVEEGPPQELFEDPRHERTQSFLSAILDSATGVTGTSG